MASWTTTAESRSASSNTSSISAHGQRHDRNEDGTLIMPEPGGDGNDLPISLSQKMLSATLGSLITSLLVTPLDVVRVRLQSQQGPSISPSSRPANAMLPSASSFSNLPPNLGISTCCREVFWMSNNSQICVASPSITTAISDPAVKASAACAAEEAQRRTYYSTLDALRKIAANEGVPTLWRGLSPTLLMAIPANVLYFASYDWMRYNNQSPLRRLSTNDTYLPLVAGSVARIVAAIAVGPIEMFRTRMQAVHSTPGKSGNFVETLQDMREMTSQRGVRTLWTGLTLTLWRDVPFSALYWWGYEYGRQKLRQQREHMQHFDVSNAQSREGGRARRGSLGSESHTATLTDSFIAGAASGAFAALVTTPFDVGKTRQQTLHHAKEVGSATGARVPEELPMPRFLWHIFKTQGTAGLFRGWAARCLKVAPACAIMISTYEVGKKMAGGINEKRHGRNADE